MRGVGAYMLPGVVTALLGATALPAAAQPVPLSQEKYINDRLIAARIADRIRKECPSIEGRRLFAFGQARKLYDYARSKGYDHDEIVSYIDDDAAKKRVYAVADDYMARNGVVKGDAESYCRLGRDEIARKTVSGSLLSAK
ncbi:DUF5333 domain-containing protein [Paracoccus sp. (in: a-proteobacteria)]|uniref:DUF5333 domain-containing protein n=1 Tax=Paracoccus sp. TaxID=267 RepID=UPI003A8B5512